MRQWKPDNGRLAARLILLWPLAVALIATATLAANTSEPYVTSRGGIFSGLDKQRDRPLVFHQRRGYGAYGIRFNLPFEPAAKFYRRPHVLQQCPHQYPHEIRR